MATHTDELWTAGQSRRSVSGSSGMESDILARVHHWHTHCGKVSKWRRIALVSGAGNRAPCRALSLGTALPSLALGASLSYRCLSTVNPCCPAAAPPPRARPLGINAGGRRPAAELGTAAGWAGGRAAAADRGPRRDFRRGTAAECRVLYSWLGLDSRNSSCKECPPMYTLSPTSLRWSPSKVVAVFLDLPRTH